MHLFLVANLVPDLIIHSDPLEPPRSFYRGLFSIFDMSGNYVRNLLLGEHLPSNGTGNFLRFPAASSTRRFTGFSTLTPVEPPIGSRRCSPGGAKSPRRTGSQERRPIRTSRQHGARRVNIRGHLAS